MTAHMVIDLGVAVPVYGQIRSQLAGAISSGHLLSGSRLPSVRTLAADLRIAAARLADIATETRMTTDQVIDLIRSAMLTTRTGSPALEPL